MQAFNVGHEKVNINGGAIAMGHPLGATGTMIAWNVLVVWKIRQNVASFSLCSLRYDSKY